MNLKNLQTFLILSKEKNFTKTAAVLGCAQSAVTTQIKQLEESLGAALFERIGKHTILTFEGEQLLPYARKILSLSGEIQCLYQKNKRLTIGLTDSIANYLFGDILKEFSAVHPDTEIFLKILNGKDYCKMLCDGEIDAAIVLDTKVSHKSVRILQKRKETVILAASSTHEALKNPYLIPHDFETFGLLLPLPDCAYRKIFEQTLLDEGVRFKTALETDSVSVIKESSLCGIGIGLLPEFAVRKELIYHMLEKINYTLELPVFTQLLIHPDKYISLVLNDFLETARHHLA